MERKRRNKKIDEPDDEIPGNVELLISPEETIAQTDHVAGAQVKDTVTRVTERIFVEPSPPAPIRDADPNNQDLSNVIDDDESPAEPNALQRLLATASDDDANDLDESDFPNWSFAVWRKADATAAGMRFAVPNVVKVFKGQIPFDETLYSDEAIQLRIQSTFGGGVYDAILQRKGTRHKYFSFIIGDPLTAAEQPALNVSPTPAPSPASIVPHTEQKPVDSMAELKRTLEQAEEIRKLLTPTPAPVVVTPPAVPDRLGDLIFKRAEDDPDLFSLIVKSVYGTNDEPAEFNWIGEIFKHKDELFGLANGLINTASRAFENAMVRAAQANAAPGTSQPPAAIQNGTNDTNGARNALPPRDPMFELFEPYRMQFGVFAAAIYNNDAPAPIATTVKNVFDGLDPESKNKFQSLFLMSGIQFITFLAEFLGEPRLLALRHAGQWSDEFMSVLRGEDQNEQESDE